MFTLALTTAFALLSSLVASQPCDIYAIGNTPCVAAHSTTRALYSKYNGPLYEVVRASDGQYQVISTVSAGGIANSGVQDSFCAGTTCSIYAIYDQSGNGNDLLPAPPGGAMSGPGPNGYDLMANATMAPVLLNGQKVYGVYSPTKTGYRNDNTKNVPTGNNPEGMYWVVDAQHYNGICCFDYGNAETDNTDDGAGTMEALNFGLMIGTTHGAGSGPWIQADLENGIFAGNTPGAFNTPASENPNNPTITSEFATGIVKGDSSNLWAIRGGDAQSGGLTTFYSGSRPSGYYPMNKKGAIILGIGGDNSNNAVGTFYEGAMVSGYPNDNIEAYVQADIVQNAKYSRAS
ncbi:alpha-L-arabinofuranosidase B [Kockovaella imperatae]|uniref:Alpha-L-arabinofuranosidase n=1 Tax=Kockovaella imperatae TaxID=4999 RepID=A0A1Y1UAS8_9TREE|nr:alpha-L-arabinofuranosidase B [Kockovaella imperatae]ORX35148.1 alpha-L-arabinofuranosidase B [Kockovaella imperatae]